MQYIVLTTILLASFEEQNNKIFAMLATTLCQLLVDI